MNKETKKLLLKHITENTANKMKNFWKLIEHFFYQKMFSLSTKITLKTNRGVTFQEKTISNVFNNHFISIAKSLNITV